MDDHQTCWIASPGTVSPVKVLEVGTGGHELTFIPKNPVVVRSVRDYYEFVASSDALFYDLGSAQTEAKRLDQVRLEDRRRILMEQLAKEDDTTKVNPEIVSFGEGLREGMKNGDPLVPESLDSESPPIPEEITEPPVEVIDFRAVSVVTSPVMESVVASEGPRTLIERIQYLIGGETLNVGQICDRLKLKGWMPAGMGSIYTALSGSENLFDRPSRGSYALKSGNQYLKGSPDLTASPTVEVPIGDSFESEEAVVEVQPEEDLAQESTPEVEVADTEYSTWLGHEMKSYRSERAYCKGTGFRLVEHHNGGQWLAEISVEGMSLWVSGNSKFRNLARTSAEVNLRTKIDELSSILKNIGFTS